MRFAEERREVRGERIRERFPLARVVARFELVEVVAKALDAKRAQAPRKPAVRHVALVVRQRDARAAVNERANALEVRRGELEVAIALAAPAGRAARQRAGSSAACR